MIDEHAAPFVAAFKPYFKDDPKFDRANTVLAMEECGESDLEELTIEKLRDFCIRQTKPPAQAPPIESARSAWTTFINRAENREASIDSQSLDRSSFVGLEISGPCGGQWLIEITANNLKIHVRAAKAAAVRWLTTANTMNHLLDGGLPVENALTNGLLVIENDAVSPTSAPEFLAASTQSHLNQLSSIIAAFRDHSRSHQARSSEVTHVG